MKKTNNQYMAMPNGFSDLEKAVKRIKMMSANIANADDAQSISIPGMLWITEPGIGQRKLLEYTAQCLNGHDNIINFEGNEKYIEFTFGYCSKESDNPEIKRLIERMRQAAGFRYEYRGIVCIDVSEWVEHEDEKHFITLLEYLRDNSDRWLVILTITPQDNMESDNMEHVISVYLRIQKIVLYMPDTKHLIEYVAEKLEHRSFPLTPEAKDTLIPSLERMRDSKTFSGFYTLDKLCDDITFEAYSAVKPVKAITKEIASKFSITSSYIERVIYRKEKNRIIGFVGGQNER